MTAPEAAPEGEMTARPFVVPLPPDIELWQKVERTDVDGRRVVWRAEERMGGGRPTFRVEHDDEEDVWVASVWHQETRFPRRLGRYGSCGEAVRACRLICWAFAKVDSGDLYGVLDGGLDAGVDLELPW